MQQRKQAVIFIITIKQENKNKNKNDNDNDNGIRNDEKKDSGDVKEDDCY